jgi:hypothetical protein
MFFSVFVTEDYYPQRFETKQTLRLIDLALTQLERNKATIELALNASDIGRINKAGRMAAILDLEGGFDLDGDPGVLRNLYRQGRDPGDEPARDGDQCIARLRPDDCSSARREHDAACGDASWHARAE